jgi:hypothetical protein
VRRYSYFPTVIYTAKLWNELFEDLCVVRYAADVLERTPTSLAENEPLAVLNGRPNFGGVSDSHEKVSCTGCKLLGREVEELLDVRQTLRVDAEVVLRFSGTDAEQTKKRSKSGEQR